MGRGMSVNDLVLVQGMRDTKLALARWNRAPGVVLRPWCLLSAAIAVALLLAVYAVAKLSAPDRTLYLIPGYNTEVEFSDYLHVLLRNSLVLSLHALACVAGFMAGSSLPLSASHRSGVSRWVHEKAGPLAIGFVVCATLFSLVTQAYILGGEAAALAGQIGTTPGALLLTRLPHAAARAVRALPPARGLDDREPPRRLARAARRDLRDGGDRRADHPRLGCGRGVGVAAPPARARQLERRGAARRPPLCATASA